MLGYHAWDEHFGELVQAVFDTAAGTKIRVELSAAKRATEREEQVGASGLEGISIFLIGLAAREAMRIAERIFDAALDWIVRHRGGSQEEVAVEIYGPNGEVIKSVLVDPEGHTRDWPTTGDWP